MIARPLTSSRFEELRNHRGPWSIVHTPRINPRGEEGPISLDVHQLVRTIQSKNGVAQAASN